jgi:hypothetical protein
MKGNEMGCEGCNVPVSDNCYGHYLDHMKSYIDFHFKNPITRIVAKRAIRNCPCSDCVVKIMCTKAVFRCDIFKETINENLKKFFRTDQIPNLKIPFQLK